MISPSVLNMRKVGVAQRGHGMPYRWKGRSTVDLLIELTSVLDLVSKLQKLLKIHA